MTLTLHLGCGDLKHQGAIGIDIYRGSDADVIYDLNEVPYPFAPSSFDEFICEHVLEHLDDIIAVIEELNRIARPGARLIVEVPHFSSVYYYQDPTHRHSFTSRTFDYFVPGSAVHRFGYSQAELRVINIEFPPPAGASLAKRTVFDFINKHIDGYEKRFAFIFPRHLIRFELEFVKYHE